MPEIKITNSGTKFYNLHQSNIHPAAKIGKNCVIHSHVWIGEDVVIGDRVKIEAGAQLFSGLVVEDDVFIGPQVCFTNDAKLSLKGKPMWKKTLVKKGAKIGAGANILAGVIIGEGAVVGMGSVVLKDIPTNEVWVGNPAHKLEKK